MKRILSWSLLIVVAVVGVVSTAAVSFYASASLPPPTATQDAPQLLVAEVGEAAGKLSDQSIDVLGTPTSQPTADDVRSPHSASDSDESAPPGDDVMRFIEPTNGEPMAMDDFLKRVERISVVFSDRKVRFPIDRKIAMTRLAASIQSLTSDKKSRARLTVIGKELVMRVDRDNAVHVVHALTHLLYEEYDVLPRVQSDQGSINLPDGRRGTLADLAIGPEGVRTLIQRANRIALVLGVYNINFETPHRIHRQRLTNRILSLKEIDPAIRFIDGRDCLYVLLSAPATNVVQIAEAITRELAFFDADEYDREVAAVKEPRPSSDLEGPISRPETVPSQFGDRDPTSVGAIRPPAADASVRLQERYSAKEEEAAALARQFAITQRPSLGRKLREVVAESFALRQQLHQVELAEFQARMARINRLIESRDSNKDQIIDSRVKDLLDTQLKWEPVPADSKPARPVSRAETPVVSEGDDGLSRPTAIRRPRGANSNFERSEPLSPLQVVAQGDKLLERESIVVRFRVGSVDTIKVTMPNVETFQLYRLLPDVNADPALDDSFCVVLEYGIENALKHLGIKDLTAHFKNKTIEVQGRLSDERSPIDPSENLRKYDVKIHDLDQLRIVASAASAAPRVAKAPAADPSTKTTPAALSPRDQARQILKEVLDEGTQPLKSNWFEDEYPYAESDAEYTRKQNAGFLPDYVALLNDYLEKHQVDYGTRPYTSAVQSLEYVSRSWFAGDQWHLDKTTELLVAALATDLTSPVGADRDNPQAEKTQSELLRQLARLTLQIPEAVAKSVPHSQKTREKLALLTNMLSHRANDRWVSQEQVRLAGLLDEAPFHTVRAIMQAAADQDSASVEKWLYAVSSPAAYDAYRSSPQQKVIPPLDPILMLAILRKIAGEQEPTDARIARVFANPHPCLLFPRHIDDVLSGRWAFREPAHYALLEMATNAKSVELRTQIEKLDPRVAAERNAGGR